MLIIFNIRLNYHLQIAYHCLSRIIIQQEHQILKLISSIAHSFGTCLFSIELDKAIKGQSAVGPHAPLVDHTPIPFYYIPWHSLLSRLPAIYLQITTMKSFQHMLLSSLVLLAMQDQGAVATDVCHSSDTDESQCQDSPLNFELNGKTRDCAWVAKKPKKRCKKSEVKSHCPVTCLMFGSFKPEGKAELQVAVNAWIADPTSAAINYGPINAWDTSLVADMSYLFDGASAFNHDISNWNTAAVTNMGAMFNQASSFNHDLSNWNTAAVTNMGGMFYQASAFNHNLSDWNTTVVTDMQSMFNRASSFNGDISNWSTSAVTNMAFMFSQASAFNHNLSDWNTTVVTDMRSMLNRASSFNGDISNWSTSAMTNMAFMFIKQVLSTGTFPIGTQVPWHTCSICFIKQDLSTTTFPIGTRPP
jgi:surface protein